MPATFAFSESNSSMETATDGISNVNFGNLDAPNLSSPNNRIVAGNNSFEKWVRGKFSGSYTTVDNLKFWKSAGSLPVNVSIKAEVNDMFAEPTDSTSSVATAGIPTSVGSALVPDSPGASPDYSGYITMQMQTTGAAPAGDSGVQTYTLR